MKATELRIGNFVFDDDTDKIMVVSKIETEEFTDWNSGEEFSITCLEFGTKKSYYDGVFRPIPLTEEWLLKFGFKYNKGFDIYQKDDFIIRRKDFVLCNIDIEVKFEYVHRLQNAYFELKNKELCYNFVITK